MISNDALARVVRYALRKIGCYHLIVSGGHGISADVKCNIFRAPGISSYYLEIQHADFPVSFGYAMFERRRSQLEQLLSAQIDLYMTESCIVIACSPVEPMSLPIHMPSRAAGPQEQKAITAL